MYTNYQSENHTDYKQKGFQKLPLYRIQMLSNLFNLIYTCMSWMANTSLTVILSKSSHLLINALKGGQISGLLYLSSMDL